MSTLKKVIVTGASGGIGRTLVHQLIEAGVEVCAIGRSAQKMQACLPAQSVLVEADLTTHVGRQTIFEAAQAFAPQCLINLAGDNAFVHFTDQDDDQIAQLIQLNLTAQLQLTRLLVPVLAAQPQAQIINVGSTLGSIGYPGYAVYCATKFGLRGFSEALARELADSAVRVRYFAPRATATAVNSQAANALNNALGSAIDTPESVAGALINFAGTSAVNQYLGWPEKLFVRINNVLPGLVSRSIKQQLKTIKHFLNMSRTGG